MLRRAEPVDRFELGKPEPLPLLGDEGGRPGALPASGSSPLRDRTGGAVLSRSQVSTSAFHETPQFSHRPHVYDVHGGFIKYRITSSHWCPHGGLDEEPVPHV